MAYHCTQEHPQVPYCVAGAEFNLIDIALWQKKMLKVRPEDLTLHLLRGCAQHNWHMWSLTQAGTAPQSTYSLVHV